MDLCNARDFLVDNLCSDAPIEGHSHAAQPCVHLSNFSWTSSASALTDKHFLCYKQT